VTSNLGSLSSVQFETLYEEGVSPNEKIRDLSDERCFSPHDVRTPFDETYELADYARNVPPVSDKMTIDVKTSRLN
jgi:hypothetical protein